MGKLPASESCLSAPMKEPEMAGPAPGLILSPPVLTDVIAAREKGFKVAVLKFVFGLNLFLRRPNHMFENDRPRPTEALWHW